MKQSFKTLFTLFLGMLFIIPTFTANSADKNKLTNFIEKPTRRIEVSMGIYMVNKKILKFIPNNKKFGFNDLIESMIKKKQEINVYKAKKLWFDIGKAKDLSEATDYFLKYKRKFLKD